MNISRLTSNPDLIAFYMTSVSFTPPSRELRFRSDSTCNGVLEHLQYCQCYAANILTVIKQLKNRLKRETDGAKLYHSTMINQFRIIQDTLKENENRLWRKHRTFSAKHWTVSIWDQNKKIPCWNIWRYFCGKEARCTNQLTDNIY